MKSKAQPLSFFSMNPLKSVSSESTKEHKSPFLRAVLSGSNKTNASGNNKSATDKDAALRYIRESKMLNKK